MAVSDLDAVKTQKKLVLSRRIDVKRSGGDFATGCTAQAFAIVHYP
jgi:hypothetical protein